MDEPLPAPVAESSAGFSCPGPFYLPGLLAVPSIHIGVLAGLVGWVREYGPSWVPVGVALGGLAAFWVAFLLVAWWLGGRAAVNVLGLAWPVLFWVGLVAAAVWWLAR
jgi:hypothetical protein